MPERLGTFTYKLDFDTDRDKLRLIIGDTNEDRPMFWDAEIAHFIAEESNLLRAGANALDFAANRFARDFDFTTDGSSFKKSQVAKALKDRAQELREEALRAGGGVIDVTRVDGHSDDISALATTPPLGSPINFDVGRWDEVGV